MFKGKLLTLRLIATLLILLIFTLPYYSPMNYASSLILLVITLVVFYILEHKFKKRSEKDE